MKLRKVKPADTIQEPKVNPTVEMLLGLFSRVANEIDGGLHYSVYSKAMTNSLKKTDDYYPDNGKINVTFEDDNAFWMPIDIICNGVYVVVSASNMLVEKDYRNAKRIMRYDNECETVLLLNVDWYGIITYEIFTRDGVSI